eukprot:scaffold315233_cov26-Tisochrysis_lutea.AAC.3
MALTASSACSSGRASSGTRWGGSGEAASETERCAAGVMMLSASRKSSRSTTIPLASISYRSSSSKTCGKVARSRRSAASAQSALRSAPQKPCVRAASSLRSSTAGGGCHASVWMRRMASRSLEEGSANWSSRSKRPGRRRAASSESIRLVAPIRMTWRMRRGKGEINRD